MNLEPHIKIEGNSKFTIGELIDNTVYYDFEKIKTYLNIKGNLLFGKGFKLYKEDEQLLFRLCCYFIRDRRACENMGIDIDKGLLLSGPVGCGKTSLMKLLPHIAPHKTNYEIIPTRNIVFNFNTSGFEILEQFNDTKNYCFDDLGVEPTGSHYAKECNVMGEILISRYDLFTNNKSNPLGKSRMVGERPAQSAVEGSRSMVAERSRSMTHITTNLNAQELEDRYGNRVRSRMRELFNLIAFDKESMDKRK